MEQLAFVHILRSESSLSFPSYYKMSTDYKAPAIAALQTMYLGEKSAGEHFKAKAYKTAMDALRAMEGPLTTVADFKAPKGVGPKIIKKLEEVIATGGLAAAERMKARTDIGSFETLTAVHGIGPVKARGLIASGIKTIAGLRAAYAADPDLLTSAQALGLKYYEDGIQRIPRPEMVKHEALLLSVIPAGMTGTIVGSYRRGAPNSGDIDMLVTYNEAMTEKAASAFFKGMIAELTTRGYILDKLAGGGKKWMGYVRLGPDGVARRLDLLLTPPEEYAYAILYFTGSDKFNIAFRRHCLDIGYTLNEHTMKPTGSKPAPPPMKSEEAIFCFVGLKFVPPTERVDAKQIARL